MSTLRRVVNRVMSAEDGVEKLDSMEAIFAFNGQYMGTWGVANSGMHQHFYNTTRATGMQEVPVVISREFLGEDGMYQIHYKNYLNTPANQLDPSRAAILAKQVERINQVEYVAGRIKKSALIGIAVVAIAALGARSFLAHPSAPEPKIKEVRSHMQPEPTPLPSSKP